LEIGRCLIDIGLLKREKISQYANDSSEMQLRSHHFFLSLLLLLFSPLPAPNRLHKQTKKFAKVFIAKK
jgi:hypothetical protein